MCFISFGNSAGAILQVQLTMLAVALLTTFPLLCSAGHLAHTPYASAVRAFAEAAEDFSGAVFPMTPGQQSASQQCRQLHLLVYVRMLFPGSNGSDFQLIVCTASRALLLLAQAWMVPAWRCRTAPPC